MSGQLDEVEAPVRTARHRCVVCNARKHAHDFPFDTETRARILVTCSDCAGNAVDANRRDQQQTAAAEAVAAVAAPAPALRKRKRAAKEDYPQRRKKARSFTAPKQPRELRPRIATCRICIEEKPIEDFIKAPPKPKARTPWWMNPPGEIPHGCVDHLTTIRNNKAGPVCRMCIGATLVASIELKGPERLGCPDETCRVVWDSTDYVSRFLSAEEYNAYSDKLFDTWKKVNKLLKQCVNPDCGKLALIESNTPGFPHVHCVHCEKHMCVSCQVEW
jgi:hypothetical protein